MSSNPLPRRPVAAALGVAAMLVGAGTAAANDWLPIFRTEHVEPLHLSASDLLALPDLSEYGELTLTDELDVRAVDDASTARSITGLDVPIATSVPLGISGEPVYRVADAVEAIYTFSSALPAAPPGLGGSELRFSVGPAVAAIWPRPTGVPGLVVSRAVAPTAVSSRVPLTTIRDYLLSLPGVSEELATQLRTFDPDGSTLPLPVPGDFVGTSDADVNGVTATVLSTRDRSLAGVLWVDGGVVTLVAGTLDTDEALAVARGLR
jgi:hypothetical protein